MQSNPPVSPGCECTSGIKSFPLHCPTTTNRVGLCVEAFQLHCWTLLVPVFCECVHLGICASVCFSVVWKGFHQYSSVNDFFPTFFSFSLPKYTLATEYLVLLTFAVMKSDLCCGAVNAQCLLASLLRLHTFLCACAT